MLGDAYVWIKAFHIISFITWMAGMLYLPRLFVYHTGVEVGSQASEVFKVMERRLLRFIMNPALIAVFVTGLLLTVNLGSEAFTAGWLHAKITCVVILAAMHGLFARCRRAFAEDRNKHSALFFRITNEVPTLLMIAVVIFVVAKPI